MGSKQGMDGGSRPGAGDAEETEEAEAGTALSVDGVAAASPPAVEDLASWIREASSGSQKLRCLKEKRTRCVRGGAGVSGAAAIDTTTVSTNTRLSIALWRSGALWPLAELSLSHTAPPHISSQNLS